MEQLTLAEQKPFHSSLPHSHDVTRHFSFLCHSLLPEPLKINNSFFPHNTLMSCFYCSTIQGSLVWIYVTKLWEKKHMVVGDYLWGCNELLLTTFDLIYLNVLEGFPWGWKSSFFFSLEGAMICNLPCHCGLNWFTHCTPCAHWLKNICFTLR